MRDILNLLDYLTESTGLAGRKPGDIFKNSQGDELVFNELRFFPEGGGKYTPQEMDNAIEQVTQQNPGIQWQNKRTAKSGGFGVASFSSSDGNVYIGRFLETIKPTFTDNSIPNSFGDYKFGGKAAEKAQSGLSPQDLLTNKIDLTIPDIMNQLAQSLGTDNPLYAVAHRIALGEPLPMEFPAPEGISFTAFRDYFCEILQPMALQKGQWTGSAGEAVKRFLGGTFEGTLISFDDTKTAGLSDSILTNKEGQYIKVSTKGGKGATASAKNLIDSINELQDTVDGKKLLNKHKDVVKMLNEIISKGQAGSPLYLGVRFNIITDDDAKKIASLKNSGITGLDNVRSLGLSKGCEKLALERNAENPKNVNLYYHLIAAVAHEAAEKVNSQTNFSEAAAEILNNGALIQVYTKANEGKLMWKLGEFDTVYPGTSIKGVYLSAGKTYYSTGIKGNFTFKIDKGQGKPKDDQISPASAEPDTSTDADFAASAELIATGKPTRKDTGAVGVGRKKR